MNKSYMLVICLLAASFTGCLGSDETITCEDEITLIQEYNEDTGDSWGYECMFTGGLWGYRELSIEVTSTGESPVHIFTFNPDQLDSWTSCEYFDYYESFSELNSTGTSIKEKIDAEDFYVVFDHPNSCDEEETSAVVEISFKVTAT
jgi:hypothetical protein